MMRLAEWRFGRFIFVGVLSAAIDLAVVWLLDRLAVAYALAVTAGFLAGLALNYLLHAHFTFDVQDWSAAQLSRFLVVVLVNYLLTLSIVALLHGSFGVDVVIAKIVSLPFVAVNGYVLSRVWVFRAEPP
jgi:putative flippase GtrA